MTPDNDSLAAPPPRKNRRMLKVGVWVGVALALAVGLVALVLNVVVAAYRVPSEGMAPTLKPGDSMLVNKFVYRREDPQPGDVIVFNIPQGWNVKKKDDPGGRYLLVKRVIAIGGQTVQCRADTGLTVDGKWLPEPYIDPQTMQADPNAYPCLGPEFGPVAVPADRLWVMGDNRTHSADSRANCETLPSDARTGVLCTGDPVRGTVPVTDVVGRVVFRQHVSGNG